jgi:hypothetical protein
MPLRHGKATVVARAFDELKKFCVTVGIPARMSRLTKRRVPIQEYIGQQKLWTPVH